MEQTFGPNALAKPACLAAITSTALIGCATVGADPFYSSNDKTSASPGSEEDTWQNAPMETASLKSRLVVTHDVGIKVLDANSLEIVAEPPLDGYLSLNPIGDDRHISVSAPGGFYLLDLGVWSETHGDHSHYYTQAPSLTAHPFVTAERPGHVIFHDGMVAFYDYATATGTNFSLEGFPIQEPFYTYKESKPHQGFLIPPCRRNRCHHGRRR